MEMNYELIGGSKELFIIICSLRIFFIIVFFF